MRRRCGLTSNYFDHFFLLLTCTFVVAVNRSPVAGATSVLGTFPTESVSVLTLRFSKYNYLIAAGGVS